MAEKIPTLKHLADELGVSISTVSRALQDHPSISDETSGRIKQLAERKGYVPNGVARGLKKQQTKTIAVLVPEIQHAFFSSAIDGIEEIAYNRGFTVHIAKSNEEYQREVVNTQSFRSNRVAGVIASISQNTHDGAHFQKLIDVGIPVVLFDRVLEDLDVNKVIVDDYTATLKAVNHFIDSGYQRIALLSGPEHLNIAIERGRGFRDALASRNLVMDESLVLVCDLTEEEGERGMRELLANPNPPDAVFAMNDPLAVGAHRQIKSAGLLMPEDIGLMGFSNNPITAMIDPPITTTDQHGYELGRKAARILFSEIDGSEEVASPQTYVVASTFIVRKSSQRTGG